MAKKNSELIKEIEELIKKYNKKPEKNIRKRDIVELFQDTVIIIPCRTDFSDTQAYEECIEGVQLKPDIVKDEKNVRMLPVFTSYEQVPVEYMEKFSLVRIEAAYAYSFMNESEYLHGLVINPFSAANMELRKKKTAVRNATKNYVKQISQEQKKDAIIIHNNQKYTIDKSPFTIGRTGTDLVISQTYVSKVHAVISYKDGKYRLADYESTNGTKLNGKELTPKVYYELRDGAEIQISDKDILTFYFD